MPLNSSDPSLPQFAVSRRYPRPGRRLWYRHHFLDHPGYERGDPEAFAGRGRTRDKVKLFCRECFERELDSLTTHHGQPYWDRDAAASQLWAAVPPSAKWIANRPMNCLVHLRDCEHQPHGVRHKANQDLTDSPSHSRQRSRTRSPSPHVPMLSRGPAAMWHEAAARPSPHSRPGLAHVPYTDYPPDWLRTSPMVPPSQGPENLTHSLAYGYAIRPDAPRGVISNYAAADNIGSHGPHGMTDNHRVEVRVVEQPYIAPRPGGTLENYTAMNAPYPWMISHDVHHDGWPGVVAYTNATGNPSMTYHAANYDVYQTEAMQDHDHDGRPFTDPYSRFTASGDGRPQE